ncbi:sporulation-specific diadenylate cyclase CdaS [Bacillus sp. 31A1R]|uniref:Diadenylate cyclase n=1 Tax=Robertmurraya mangrovi TaxID=3098077 RepID=A0ABU5J322_9BACI|nr:sporulation-specific diadenylate cyclase CdaS [Bacillus sp. 31A1R]MDZ5473746.1 sporulation-specific diadenylate cyclase CdaS [Bacillus sp. 31A1R]
MVYEDKQYQSDINRYLKEMDTQILKIQDTLAEMNCCILSDFEKLHHLVTDAQGLASSYYLQSYLSPYTKEFGQISLAVNLLSEKRHGALIIIERKQPLDEWIHNGTKVGAKVSHTLLETIFYPGNPLHDGGTLIKEDVIVSASNILPLSKNVINGKKLGTRHRAAIGLTEKTDAIVIVVSEETGKITFALNGELYVVKQ